MIRMTDNQAVGGRQAAWPAVARHEVGDHVFDSRLAAHPNPGGEEVPPLRVPGLGS